MGQSGFRRALFVFAPYIQTGPSLVTVFLYKVAMRIPTFVGVRRLMYWLRLAADMLGPRVGPVLFSLVNGIVGLERPR